MNVRFQGITIIRSPSRMKAIVAAQAYEVQPCLSFTLGNPDDGYSRVILSDKDLLEFMTDNGVFGNGGPEAMKNKVLNAKLYKAITSPGNARRIGQYLAKHCNLDASGNPVKCFRVVG